MAARGDSLGGEIERGQFMQGAVGRARGVR
jgi:hypothetical protein